MISRIGTRILSFLAPAIVAGLIAPSDAHAQNILVDGGFDGAPQLTHGNHFADELLPWQFATIRSTGDIIQHAHNLVVVDGIGGYNYGNNGPESDASGAAAGVKQYYIDSGNTPTLGWQYFTPSCSGTATATVHLTNREEDGWAGPMLTGGDVPTSVNPSVYFNTEGGLAVFPVTTEVPVFVGGFGVNAGIPAQRVIAQKAQFDTVKLRFLLGGGTTQTYPWTPLSTQVPVTAGQTYAYMVELGHSVNMDNASVELDCDDPVVPVQTDITVTKICAAPVAGVHNGVSGMFWDCVIDVQGTLNTQPNQGILHVNDLVTTSTGSNAEIVSMTSQSGNMNCTYNNGQSCLVGGNAFDTTNGETVDVQLFLSGSPAPAQHTVENCAQVLYYKNGQASQFPQSCASAQWTLTPPAPALTATKSCDPIVATPNGTYLMSCQFDVTATGQPASNYILAADFFAGLPPMTATITGQMMNVTSNEPWNCADIQLNTPGSSGLCELSAADMVAAGGQSTFNVTFEFTTDQEMGQVANCPMSISIPDSFITNLGGRSSGLPMRSPQTDTAAQLPDGCVVLDLPKEEIKIEHVESSKKCDQPTQAVINGVLGYSWDCQAKITVTPTPFAGTYTLVDDASNISIGTAEFVSISETNCSPLGLDNISCVLDGSTMSSPHYVDYQLFTPLTDPNQPIEWTNCLDGHVDTAAGVFPAVPMCTGRVIKPEIVVVDPKEINLKKSCGKPVDATHDGQTGKMWSCEITVNATPAPFAGSFSFVEDASAVSGTSSANIIGYNAANAGWACSGSFPQQQTQCSINGAIFSPSGVETVQFDLFAANQGSAVEWKNCVSGTYVTDKGEARKVKGNCVGTEWNDPKEPPVISLKKGCRQMGVENGNAHYLCSIYVSPPSSGAVTGPLTVEELFTTASGAPATQYIQALIGTPATPNGWTCQQPNFPSGASCTISAADFNGNTGHRIDAQITIPTAVLEKEGFKNCAQVRMGNQVVGNADCVDIVIDTDKVEFDVEKTCKPLGDRQILGSTGWVQPYQCTLTVTTNGVPFTDPLWVTEDLHFGTNSGAGQIQSLTSADPWSCSSPPYSAPGQGSVPYCGIQGAQFPASGTSTITVDLMMNGAMDQFGAENCVSLSVGQPTANGLPTPIASDCFEFAPAPDPTLEITKTCEPAVRGANNLWTAQCSVTVTGANLPSGQEIRITDELTGSGQTTVDSGYFHTNPLSGSNCGGFAIAGGVGGACSVLSDDLMANNGQVSFDYTAVLSGAGLLQNAPGQNCAFADIASLGLHAPTTANGKVCVDIPLLTTAVIGTGVISVDPKVPAIVDPGTTVEVAECSTDVLFVVDQSSSMNQHNRLGKTRLAIQQAMNVFQGNGSAASLVTFSDLGQVVIAPAQVIPSGNMLSAVLGLSGTGATNWADGLAKARIVVTAATKKPLVLFITDGGPNRPLGPDQWGLPPIEVAAIRAQGSRVIGIGLNQSFIQSALVSVFGPNVANVGNGDIVNPLVNDGIIIPNNVDYADVFEQIALAYCPTFAVEKSQGTIIDLKLPTPPYMGDDEPLEQDAVVQPAAPALSIAKQQTAECVANRDSQTYDCGFRLSVTNTGNQPYVGPLVMTDTGGSPGIRSAKPVSGNGWSCGAVVRDTVSCTNPAVNLTPGATSYVDLRMKVKGLRKGGSYQNCASTGVTPDRKQRVALIQKIMNDRGLKAGPVDGDPGRKTYAALAKLRANLGLPVSREFDDALFIALGLPLQQEGAASCVTADLAPMPAPPLQCNRKTTVQSGESCACRYDNMKHRNATSCQCRRGYSLVAGKGCRKVETPTPTIEPGLKCDLRSTYLRGDICACIDHKNARNISKTRCGCKSGLPMINGKCIPVKIRVSPGRSSPDVDSPSTPCRVQVGGICIK